MKFKKVPVEIEAFYLGWHDLPDWFMDRVTDNTVILHMERNPNPKGRPFNGHCTIKTLEGEMRANAGDWIIRGIEGELYPCKHSVFVATYERVEGP